MGALRMLRAIVIVLVVALLPSHARAQERIALLIGNQGYTDKVGPLKKPHHDIAIVGKALPIANLIGLASAGNMGDAVVRCGTCAN